MSKQGEPILSPERREAFAAYVAQQIERNNLSPWYSERKSMEVAMLRDVLVRLDWLEVEYGYLRAKEALRYGRTT